MLIEFSIKNFRSIKDKLTLSFKPRRALQYDNDKYYFITLPNTGEKVLKLAFLYGANASGKTNILKGLDFLRFLILRPRKRKTDSLSFEPFLFDREYNEDTEFTIEFFQNNTKYLYEITLNREFIVKENLYFYRKSSNIL